MPYAENKGVKIYYESYGQGTPIIFLHGMSCNSYVWMFQIFPLSNKYQCVAIDLRGHGRSDKPHQGYSPKEMAEDVVAVLDTLKIEQAVLVAAALGGMVGLQFNLDYPHRLLGNVIMSTATGLGDIMPPEVMAAWKQAAEPNVKHQEFVGALSKLCTSAKTNQERPELLPFLESMNLSEDNFPHHTFTGIVNDPQGIFNWNITEQIKNIQVPTLIVGGKEDQLIPVDLLNVLPNNIPNAQIQIIDDVAHSFYLEKPTDFNNLLQNFIEQL